MATVEEKVNCVLWLAEVKSANAVKRRAIVHYRKVHHIGTQTTFGWKVLKELDA
jgi:hypothetical protein